MMLRCFMVVLSTALLSAIACGGAPPSRGGVDSAAPSSGQAGGARSGVIDHVVVSLQGEPVDLAQFRGRPLLIVNTASECGYTPQYAGLQKLWETYGDRGLVVIGFPSNDFGNQEPGTADDIQAFCRLNYGVTFPMMAKVHTRGPNQAPVYRSLTMATDEQFRGEVQWNFTKFLVDGDGRVVGRFEPEVEPLDPMIISAIEGLLANDTIR